MLLRRVDDATNFDREWNAYKKGFGDLEKNVWLGNDYIHRLTKNTQALLFDAEAASGDNGYTLYNSFRVQNESNKYKMYVDGYASSAMRDCMSYSRDMYFTTKDQDNDEKNVNCAVLKGGGWWHKTCVKARVTGTYNESDSETRMSWKTWSSAGQWISKAQMSIRDTNRK